MPEEQVAVPEQVPEVEVAVTEEEVAEPAAVVEEQVEPMSVDEPPAENTTAQEASGRKRKEVQRFEVAEIKKVAPVVIVEGKGTRLGDLEDVKKRFDKFNGASDEAKGLHNIIWGRPGKATEAKKNLNAFSGLIPADEAATMTRALRTSSSILRVLCKVLGVHQGSVAAMSENIVEFLKNPAQKGKAKRKAPTKAAAAPAKKKPKSTPPAAKKPAAAPAKKKPKSTPPAAKKPVSKKTQEKPPKETKEPVKQPEEEEERNADSSQAEIFSSKVKDILEKAGEEYLDLSFKKIRNMIEIDMDMKIEGDAKSSLKAITHELFQQHTDNQ